MLNSSTLSSSNYGGGDIILHPLHITHSGIITDDSGMTKKKKEFAFLELTL